MKSQLISGIYSIKNNVTLTEYIGSSKNIENRFKTHLSKLKNNKHTNPHLQNSVNKYGLKCFTFSILEEVKEEALLVVEQRYLDKADWEYLYNTSKIANSGGGDVVRQQMILLNLEGSIVERFCSGVETAEFLGHTMLDYTCVNTKSVKNKMYRVVTPDFYKNHIEVVESWPTYSSLSKHKSEVFNSNKYILERGEEKLYFHTQNSLAAHLKITKQRVNQIIKSVDIEGDRKYFHKKSGYTIIC